MLPPPLSSKEDIWLVLVPDRGTDRTSSIFIYLPQDISSISVTKLCLCNLDSASCLHKTGRRFPKHHCWHHLVDWVFPHHTMWWCRCPSSSHATQPHSPVPYTGCPLYIRTWGLIKIKLKFVLVKKWNRYSHMKSIVYYHSSLVISLFSFFGFVYCSPREICLLLWKMVSVSFRASIKRELTNYNPDYFNSDCTVSLAMLVILEKSVSSLYHTKNWYDFTWIKNYFLHNCII